MLAMVSVVAVMKTSTNAQSAAPTELLSARDLGKRAGVHPRTVFRWASAGLLSPIKINARIVRFRVDEFERLVTHATTSRSTASTPSSVGGGAH